MDTRLKSLFKDINEHTKLLDLAMKKNDLESQKLILSKISFVLDDLYMEMETLYEHDSPEIATIEQCECAVNQISPALLTQSQKEALLFALQKLSTGPTNRADCNEIELTFLHANMDVPTFSGRLFEL